MSRLRLDSGLAVAALLGLVGPGCTADLKLDTGAHVGCSVQSDCPAGWTCNTTVQQCIENSQIDTVPPALVGTPVVSPTLLRAGQSATVTFDVSKDLLAGHDPLVQLTTSPPRALSLTTSSGHHYVYTYTPLGNEPQNQDLPITIDLEDAQGLQATGLAAGALRFDFVAPALTTTPLLERCDGYPRARLAPDDLWVKPVASFTGPACPYHGQPGCPSGPVRLSLAFNKTVTLGADGIKLDDGTALTLDTCSSTGTQLVAVLETDPSPGLHAISAHVVDASQYELHATVGSLRFEDVPPPPPTTLGAVYYWRYPWGSYEDAGLKAFYVSGNDGSAVAGNEVVAYDGEDLTTAARLGSVVARDNGSFGGGYYADSPFPVASGDRPEVFVAQEDPAGNSSPAALVWEGVWIASLGYGRRGDATANPNRFLEEPTLRPSKDTTAYREPINAYELATYEDGVRGYAVITTRAEPDLHRWTARAGTPSARGGCGFAQSQAFGWGILFGGGWLVPHLGYVLSNETWSWDTSSWYQLSTVTSPPARQDHGLVHDERRYRWVMFGGTGGAGSILGDTWEFDGTDWKRVCWPGCAAGVECSCTTMPSPRSNPAMFYDFVEGATVLFGGGNGGTSYDDTWRWDGTDWSQLAPSTHPSARSGGLTSASPELGKALITWPSLGDTWIWDGSDWTGFQVTAGASSSVLWWDPDAGAWMLWETQAQQMWTWSSGSWIGATTPATIAADGSVFSGAPRTGTCGAWDSEREGFVVFGGCNGGLCDISMGGPQDETWLLTATALRKLFPGNAPPARYGGAMAYDAPSGNAWMWGGQGQFPYGDDWKWNGYAWWGSAGVDSASGRAYSALAAMSNGRLVRYGGQTSDPGASPPLWNTFVNDGGGWYSWTGAAYYPEPWFTSAITTGDNAMTYDPLQDEVVYYVGYGGNTWTGAWGRVDPSAAYATDPSFLVWTPWTPAHAPASTGGHRLVASPWGPLLFGGANGASLLDDTWLWDWTAHDWVQQTPAVRPPARRDHAMFLDAARGRVVVVGGTGSQGDLSDVWEYDGASWTQRFPAEVPSARHGMSAAYADDYGEGTLFGGLGDSLFNDTWTWASHADHRPAQIFRGRFGAAGVFDHAELRDLAVAWWTGGTGYVDAVTAADGVQLLVWDRGEWRPTVGQTVSPASAPGAVLWSVGQEPEWLAQGAAYQRRLRRLFVGDEHDVAVAVTPLAGSIGGSSAEIASQYVQMTVAYTLTCLPVGEFSTSQQRCCSGKAVARQCVAAP